MITVDKGRTLAKTCKDLMLKDPFYGMYLLMLDKRWSKRRPTMCVSKVGINYRMEINEDFWNTLTPEWRIGIVKHELLHICFFHLLRHDEFENQELANWAMDMEINQYIEAKYLPAKEMSKQDFDNKYDTIVQDMVDRFKAGSLTKEQLMAEYAKLNVPPRGVYIEDYADMKWDLRAGTRYYYDKMLEAKKQKQQSAAQGMPSMSGDSNGKGTSGCKAADEALERMAAGVPQMSDHDWEEFDQLSEAEKKLLTSQINFHLKELAESMKGRGTIPGEMKGYIDGLFETKKPKFDWKSYLRRFAGGSYKTYVVLQRRKPNKRFEDNPGIKIKDRNHILVGIDTSGSVSEPELIEFLQEIGHIFKAGTDVTVCQFDAAIKDLSIFNPKQKIMIHGRGGTDFDPIVEYANAHTRKYTALVVFTDGCAPAPEKCKLSTLWVHSSVSNINEQLPGLRIKLEL